MNSNPPEPHKGRSFPGFLAPWQEINGEDFTPIDFLNQEGSIPYVIAAQWLFAPHFVEYQSGVFLSELEQGLSETEISSLEDWRTYFNDVMYKVEQVGNLIVLDDVFGMPGADDHEDDLSQLAQTLAQCWDALLKQQFPDREFVVEVYDTEESRGPQITFYSKPPEKPGAVVVYDLSPGQFAPLEGVSDAIHVDLPPSLLPQFAQLPAQSTMLREVDVRATPDLRGLLHGFAPGATTVDDAVAQSQAEAVLFTKFEQLWVKNRPVAEQFLTELPHALDAARATGRNRHVAITDLATPTADAVLALLRSVTAPGEGHEPIPVFHYPAST